MSPLRWVCSLFAWRLVREAAVWHYYENRITGKRRAVRVSGAHQPLDVFWLNREPWPDLPYPPPPQSRTDRTDENPAERLTLTSTQTAETGRRRAQRRPAQGPERRDGP